MGVCSGSAIAVAVAGVAAVTQAGSSAARFTDQRFLPGSLFDQALHAW
jgi:hypothetical protein